jgi:CubicO group peptidase (beta-lactamase class C family)
MVLVDDGTIALDDHIDRWLPELASPGVLRRPDAPLDDVVPSERPITVEDVLTFRAGRGLPADFSFPIVSTIVSELMKDGLQAQLMPAPDDWLAGLARIPLQHQPGEAWLCNTCSDIQGVLSTDAVRLMLTDHLTPA